jgi:hypothetical protein
MFTVYTLSFLARLSQRALSLDKTVAIHLKANTGLNRLGFSPEVLPELLSKITSSAHIQLMGIFTHLGFADEKRHPQTEMQLAVFQRLSESVRRNGFHTVKTHALSTHGVLNVDVKSHDMVRVGLGLYQGAVTISAPIGYIHDVQAGEWVSYGQSRLKVVNDEWGSEVEHEDFVLLRCTRSDFHKALCIVLKEAVSITFVFVPAINWHSSLPRWFLIHRKSRAYVTMRKKPWMYMNFEVVINDVAFCESRCLLSNFVAAAKLAITHLSPCADIIVALVPVCNCGSFRMQM